MNYKKLPVYKQRSKILRELKRSNVIVVESPTGSGKTTQLPQILLEAGYAETGMIGVTQPRRIAAVSVASYIAQQQEVTIPDIVGYKMRFEDNTIPETKIKIMTDGILLQEIKADYDLSKYNAIIVDEAHERSLNIDFILGLLKRILRKRPEFKVIISSATINSSIFSAYFDGCPIVFIDTIVYPVDIHYTPMKEDGANTIPEKVTELVKKICNTSKSGDILIFLSGVKDIKESIQSLQTCEFADKLEVLPLYSRLSTEEQEKVFDPFPGKRKVVIATNIAETSVTIDGIEFVIDSGLAKLNYYNPWTFTSSLVELPISKAACNQRKGRAGRTKPGVCYRLYRYQEYEKRDLYTLEEIFRTDLSEVVMRMAEIGISDFENFDFLSSPGADNIKSAINTLKLLEALDDNRELTKTGKMMALFPLLPRHSKIIVEAIMNYPDVLEEVIIATSFLTTNSPFLLPQGEEMEARKAHHGFRDEHGDFISYLKIYDSFIDAKDKARFCERNYLDIRSMLEIQNIMLQLSEIVGDMEIPINSGGSLQDYLCAIARGLIQFVCVKMKRGGYKSLTAENIMIHPGSVMFRESPQYIVAGEIVKTSKTYARSVSELKAPWLKKVSPSLETLMGFKSGKKGEKKRDFTNQIKIGKETFKISTPKGKRKIVDLPWEKVSSALKDVKPGSIPDFKGLRGRIIYKRQEILTNLGLNAILETIPKFNEDMKILPSYPKDNLDFQKHSDKIIEYLDKILGLCKKQKSSKKLGFLTLSTRGGSVYWYSWNKSFYSALTESLASLEALVDEPMGSIKDLHTEKINKEYRKLSTLFDYK